MALYEYTCKKCEHAFEALLFAGETAKCPNCESTKLEKKWSLPAKPAGDQRNSFCETNLPPCNPNCCKLPSNVGR